MHSPNTFERLLNTLNAMSDEKKLLGIAIMTGLFLAMLSILAVTIVLQSKSDTSKTSRSYSATSSIIR